MRRISKTILSALLVVTLLFGTVVYAADNNQASSRSTTTSNGAVTLYENNFDEATITTLETEGWKGLGQYDMSNDALRGKNANAYYDNADAYNWTDYTYETKMTIATKNASNTVDGYFGVRFGVNNSGNGIEYGIHYKSSDGSFAYRVYDRINKQFLIAETSLSGKGLALDKQMVLKVEVKADTFTVYLNGESLGSATLSSNITGTVGTLMSANTVYLLYDDMKVTKVATVNTTTLYENDFDEATIATLQTEGWSGLNQYDMSNDALRGKNANAYYDNADAYNWTDYTYETKMTIATKNASNTVDGYFGVRFGVNNSGNGIEYGIHYKSSDGSFAYRVYDRINKQFLIAETSLSGKGLALDKQMTLKVEAKADIFTIYLNDENLGSATLSNNVTGTVGTLMSTNTVYLLFDDMKVTKEVVVDPNLYYQNNFDEATIDTLTAEGWTGLNQYDMSNGALRGKNANVYYNNADAYNWTDYTYETKMTIATKNASNAVDGYFGIRFGVNSSGTGIEYGIRYQSSDGSFAYRVYDRINKQHLIAETSLSGKELALDKQMALKVKVEGKTFTIYLNGESLGSATLSSNITGTVGTLMSVNTVYLLYDDMLVTKTEAQSQEPNQMQLEFDQDEIVDGAMIYVDGTTETYTISGTVTSDDENATVTINGESVLPDSQTQFSKEIALQQGVNTVEIKAKDANTDEITINFTICRSDEITMIDEDFNSYNDGDKPINTDNGWKQANSNAVVGSGKLLLDKSANLLAKDDFVDGYVSADISIEEASDVLKQAEVGKTVYPVWLTARNTYNADTHEFRARIALTKQAAGEYTAKMQVIVYSSSDYTLPQTYSYDIADFELGKAYNLKVLCVGNYFAVEMDGAVLYEGACSTTHGLYNREGSFGVIVQGNTAAISVDNVKIVKYIAKQLTVHEDCAEEIFTESFPTLTMGGSETYTRTAFHAGEHVVINVIPKEGYSLDKDSLKYSTKVGETKIVDHASEILYGFFMPAYDAVVSAEFVKGGGSVSDIYFTENFDGENSLIDNGWDYGGNISKGALVLDVDETAWSYVTGFYGASEWTDYVVEADVRVNEENEDHNVGVASISARTSGVMNGYEFGIQIATGSQRGIFRLYDRTTRTFLAQSASNLAERNTTYKLKMVLQGNRIICFVDGQLMFDITDAAKSNTIGTIGLRSLGGNGSYDNVVVRKVLPADLEGSASTSTIVGGKTSPTTGDIVKTLSLWILLITSGMAIVGYVVYTCNKSKKFSKFSRRNEG